MNLNGDNIIFNIEIKQIPGTSSFLDLIRDIYKQQGLAGFYPGYMATLAKNIPSAIVRFTVYEELKILFGRGSASVYQVNTDNLSFFRLSIHS